MDPFLERVGRVDRGWMKLLILMVIAGFAGCASAPVVPEEKDPLLACIEKQYDCHGSKDCASDINQVPVGPNAQVIQVTFDVPGPCQWLFEDKIIP